MAIKCDTCNTDVTPTKVMGFEPAGIQYEIVDIGGKICLCSNCYLALSKFVRSDNFQKEVLDKFDVDFEEEE
jgi:hypothetical protein|tara:strand:+ start:248 stop:463 length:216 start_codon:yes stop_codon:yes gene_type:complete